MPKINNYQNYHLSPYHIFYGIDKHSLSSLSEYLSLINNKISNNLLVDRILINQFK